MLKVARIPAAETLEKFSGAAAAVLHVCEQEKGEKRNAYINVSRHVMGNLDESINV
jgi:hypothetical protein